MLCSYLWKLRGIFTNSYDVLWLFGQRMESKQFHAICKVLQLFCRVRGYKYIIKFFPHEVSHVEVCMVALQSQDRTDHQNWETRYILLLWMCQLCLIPFDICSLDSTMSSVTTTDDSSSTKLNTQNVDGEDAGGVTQSRLVCDIISISREHLSESGPTREAAYACLSALFTRPDMESTLLREFMCWCCERLEAWNRKGEEAEHELTRDSFQLIGILHTMSNIFKKGHRNNVLPYANMALGPCMLLSEQNNQTLVRKLLVKVIQRIGLIFLPPREASWRYQRGSRSLLTNLNQTISSSTTTTSSCANEKHDESEDEEVDVPAELEDIVEKVLCALQDKDTVVRWSAAKGIGRITMRLPLDFGDDIVGAVVEVFSDPDDECAWHGGCLALAELSRRGLLLPERLEVVVPLVVRAMHFDLLRGQHSVGSHVRDAASYVCWAFARAYAPEVLSPFVDMFSEAMLLASLFDREINCRRAASAAFQENVGRQGNENFPFGIEVIAVADYFSLGNRNNAYLTIAPIIAELSPRFNEFIVKHLYECKLSHWDIDVRTLAAKSLGKLTTINPQYCLDALEPILASCVSPSSSATARHGGVLALGEIILTLSMNNRMSNVDDDSGDDGSSVVTIPQKIVTDTFEVVGKLDKGRMYRGRGGEQLREASCMLVECIARSQLTMPIKVQVALVENLNENLKQPHENVQRAAVKALRQMLFSYFPVGASAGPSERLQALTVQKYINGVATDMNIAVVRGYTLALGVLPPKLLNKPEGRLKEVMFTLETVMSPDHSIAGEPDAEIRRNAVESIAELGERLVPAGCFSMIKDETCSTNEVPIGYVLRLLLGACKDYSIDKRGDTGSWSRVVGMKGLERFVLAVLRSPLYTPQLIRKVGAQFSDVIKTTDGGIKVGSHVQTAFGLAVVVATDTVISNTISVIFPPQSLGAIMASPISSVKSSGKTFSVKMNKDIVLLGQSAHTLIEGSDDVNDTICDHIKRQDVIDDYAPLPQPPNVMEQGEEVSSEISHSPSSNLLIGEAEMQVVIGAILKQLGEKLDSVREVAGGVLERIIESSDPIVNMIPDKKIVMDNLDTLKRGMLRTNESRGKDIAGNVLPCHDAADVVNWTRSNLIYTFLVGLLDSQYYFNDIISGMIISIGGLSEDVVKESQSALLKWCLQKKDIKNLRDLGCLSTAMINIFNENLRNSRVTVPLMKCVCALLRSGVFDFLHCNSNNFVSGKFADNTSSFGVNLLRTVAKELNKCGELIKIRIGVDIYCLLLMFEDPLRPGALKSLLMLLGHKYPKVRQYTAEHLYVNFISDPHAVGAPASEVKEQVESVAAARQNVDSKSDVTSGVVTRSGFAQSQKALDTACEILTCTVWKDTLEVSRAKRTELCEVLGVQLNIKVKTDDEAAAAKKKKEHEKNVDELDSYDALVREAGY
jgi:hypothetical protein